MSSGGETRVRRPKQATRVLILQRAYEMYLDGRLVHGDERLSLVLDDLGYTTGAGYQIWGNQTEFRADLRVFVAENLEYAHLTKIADQLHELGQQGLTFEAFALMGADAYFEMFLGREEFYLTLRFFAMGDDRDPAVTEALIDAYERAAWDATELFTEVLDRYGRKLRAEISMGDVTVTVTALVEGYALRARVQPDATARKTVVEGRSHYVFSVAFLGVINELIEPVGERL